MIHLLSQTVPDPTSVLISYGPMGIILGWFMLRGERLVVEIRSLSHRIDGLTRALLMDMVSRDNVGLATKAAAREEIAKIEARLAKGQPSP